MCLQAWKREKSLNLYLCVKSILKVNLEKVCLLIPFTFHYETLVLWPEDLRREVEKMEETEETANSILSICESGGWNELFYQCGGSNIWPTPL